MSLETVQLVQEWQKGGSDGSAEVGLMLNSVIVCYPFGFKAHTSICLSNFFQIYNFLQGLIKHFMNLRHIVLRGFASSKVLLAEVFFDPSYYLQTNIFSLDTFWYKWIIAHVNTGTEKLSCKEGHLYYLAVATATWPRVNWCSKWFDILIIIVTNKEIRQICI